MGALIKTKLAIVFGMLLIGIGTVGVGNVLATLAWPNTNPPQSIERRIRDNLWAYLYSATLPAGIALVWKSVKKTL